MAVLIRGTNQKTIKVVRNKLDVEFLDRKQMTDRVNSASRSMISTAIKCMRKAMGCTQDENHKAIADACLKAVTASAVSMHDHGYYSDSSAADCVASSKASAASLRDLAAKAMKTKATCGTCAADMETCASMANGCADTHDQNAGESDNDADGGLDADEVQAGTKGFNEFPDVKRWESDFRIDLPDTKGMAAIKDDAGNVVDYRDITFKGYLSTFKDRTPADRDGDYVEPGAFTKSLKDFSKNPVVLRDHRNNTDNLVGQFTSVTEDQNGLLVEGKITNAPDCQSLRIKLAEGMLKGMSMGGIFRYGEDGKQIQSVQLFEGSFIPVPANADATIRCRSLNIAEQKLVKRYGLKVPADEWFAADNYFAEAHNAPGAQTDKAGSKRAAKPRE